MSSQIAAALAQLNRATERSYTVTSDGRFYTLVIPTGGEYPPATQAEMVERLVFLRIAAEGRKAK